MHSNLIKSAARIAIVAGLILSSSCLELKAQGFLNYSYDRFPEKTPPFPTDSLYIDSYIFGYNDNHCYSYMKSLRIYDNFSLNHELEYSIAGEFFDLHVLGKFSIPNANCRMILACANYADFSGSGLFLSDTNGNQLDYLACENECSEIVAKQYFIDKNYDITVYSLVPDSGDIKMLDLWDTKSFSAHRVDQKYRVINGHFILLETITYQSEVYYSSTFLSRPSYGLRYRIREGNETVESRQQQ